MIKGVNKRIIEINNPDSIYFEKAIFYLRPNVRELPAEVTQNEINKYISRMGLRTEKPVRCNLLRNTVMLIVLLCTAAALIYVFMN